MRVVHAIKQAVVPLADFIFALVLKRPPVSRVPCVCRSTRCRSARRSGTTPTVSGGCCTTTMTTQMSTGPRPLALRPSRPTDPSRTIKSITAVGILPQIHPPSDSSSSPPPSNLAAAHVTRYLTVEVKRYIKLVACTPEAISAADFWRVRGAVRPR